MKQKVSSIAIAFFAILIGLYPGLYFFYGRQFGLLGGKSEELLASTVWNTAFYTHITMGGLSLLIGWLQFNKAFREKRIAAHRAIGKIYIVAAALSAIAGITLGFSATAGIVSSAGFISLGIIWLITTQMAYVAIRNQNVEMHQKLMIYSYAACFAAVTLRIWLPILNALISDGLIAYRIVAWLCWVPNLFFAHYLIRKQNYSLQQR
jgi:uncharacterized membrane protein